MIIFPFKTALNNINEESDQNNIDYNISNFISDQIYKPAYITIKIGEPPQEIKILLLYTDCGFKIGKLNKCLNNEYSPFLFNPHQSIIPSSDFHQKSKV